MASLGTVALAAILCGTACCVQSQEPPGPGSGPPAVSTPVGVKLQADKKTYNAKDPIKLTLTVTNPGTTPVKLMFGSGMKYEFEIHKGKTAAGEKVWQWSRGRMFTQMVTFTTLDAGKKLEFSEKYVPGDKGADGKVQAQLAPGTYTAVGILQLSGRAPRPSNVTTFTVR